MGHLTNEGVAIVVPAYLACATLMVFFAIVWALIAMRRGPAVLCGSFAAWSLSIALLGFALAAFYQAETLADGLRALAWQAQAEALFLATLLVFVAAFSGYGRRALWIFAGAAAALLAASLALQVVSPGGARFALAHSAGFTHFWWGELLFYVNGRPGPWMGILYTALAALLGWMGWRVAVLRAWDEKRSAVFLVLALAGLAAGGAYAAAVDLAVVRTLNPLAPAAFCVAALLAVRLTEMLQESRGERARSEDDQRRDRESWREATGQHRIYSFADPVTGLPNRMFVTDHLGGMIERGPPARFGAVLVCTLAHYEASDRAISQAFADELMREVTLRLANAARGRALVARTSSDTFTAVMEGYDDLEDQAAERVGALADDMAHALAGAVRVGDYSLRVVARFGLATFETGLSSSAEVLARAQRALDGTRALRATGGRSLLRSPAASPPAP